MLSESEDVDDVQEEEEMEKQEEEEMEKQEDEDITDVQNNATSSSSIKRKKSSSPVWEVATQIEGGSKCKFCGTATATLFHRPDLSDSATERRNLATSAKNEEIKIKGKN